MTRRHAVALPYPPPYQTAEVLARHLSVSPQTVDAWARAGIIPPGERHPGSGVRLWKWKTVCAWLDGDKSEAVESPPTAGSADPFVQGALRAAQERQRNG